MEIENPEFDLNKEAFAKYLSVAEKKHRYIAIIDGDIVESGNDFNLVSINATSLRTQRGPGTQMDVFDTETGQSDTGV